MTKYKIYKNDYDEIQGCSSCYCEVELAPFDWGPPFGESHSTEKRMLCEICATTNIGNRTRDPRSPSYDTAVLLAQVGNHIKSVIALKDNSNE